MSAKKKARKIKKKTRPATRKKTTKKKTVKKRVARKSTQKKVVARTTVKKTAPAAPTLAPQVVGEVTHYFPHVSAGVVKLSNDLKTGDMIHIKGHTTDFKQTVESIQLDHVPLNEGKKGQEIGLKVKDRVRIGDIVYKL